jgi:hypothetical protein
MSYIDRLVGLIGCEVEDGDSALRFSTMVHLRLIRRTVGTEPSTLNIPALNDINDPTLAETTYGSSKRLPEGGAPPFSVRRSPSRNACLGVDDILSKYFLTLYVQN